MIQDSATRLRRAQLEIPEVALMKYEISSLQVLRKGGLSKRQWFVSDE